MAKLVLHLLILSSALFLAGKVESASNPTEFVRESCRATHYFNLCFQCLSSYADSINLNYQNLALTALSVSQTRARSAQSFVSNMAQVKGIKGRQYEAVLDCIQNMDDSVDRLSQSVRELAHVGRTVGQDFMWHMSNVQTWVSAALTDEDTCLDGFSGPGMDGNVKAEIRGHIVNVAQVTSNALALVNRFASKHHASTAHAEKP